MNNKDSSALIRQMCRSPPIRWLPSHLRPSQIPHPCPANPSSPSSSVSYAAYSTLPIKLIHAYNFAKQPLTPSGTNCLPPIQHYEGAPQSPCPKPPLIRLSPDEDSSMSFFGRASRSPRGCNFWDYDGYAQEAYPQLGTCVHTEQI